MRNHKIFSLFFLIVFIVQLYAEYQNIGLLRFVSKPLITIVLMAWVYRSASMKDRFHSKIFAGLAFAFAGDVLLLFQGINPMFFIFGLIAFLLCHIFYIAAFAVDFRAASQNKNPFLIWAGVVFAAFCISFFIYLKPHLGALQFPVLIYAMIISCMAVMAVSRFGMVNVFSFEMVFYGAIFFLLSDSMLAYNKFVEPLPLAGLVIMSSYMIAQYLIVLGSLTRKILPSTAIGRV